MHKFPKTLISLRKSQPKDNVMSSNNIFRDIAVKYRFLASTKSEQKSKIYRMINNSSHGMHTGRSSPFSKKTKTKKEREREKRYESYLSD